MTFKLLKLVTNHKTNNQAIEYRVYSSEDTFKTIAPTKWLHLDIEDKTEYMEKLECNAYLVRNAIKGNMGKGVELNTLIHKYVSQSMTRHDAIAAFASQNNIKQIA